MKSEEWKTDEEWKKILDSTGNLPRIKFGALNDPVFPYQLIALLPFSLVLSDFIGWDLRKNGKSGEVSETYWILFVEEDDIYLT